MFETTQDLKDRLDLTSNTRGLSVDNPIVITIDNDITNNKAVRFIVSYTEPGDFNLPLNVLWYVKDSNSPDFNKILRRVSRIGSPNYTSTWVEENSVDILQVDQTWDTPIPEDQELYDHSSSLGNVHNLTAEDLGAFGTDGGELKGPLILRDSETYLPKEAVPRAWIDAALTAVYSITEHILQSFDNINSQLSNLRKRVEILELYILGSKCYNFISESSQVWNINHKLNSVNLHVHTWEDGNLIGPSSVKIIDADNIVIKFARPVEGVANIVPSTTYAD